MYKNFYLKKLANTKERDEVVTAGVTAAIKRSNQDVFLFGIPNHLPKEN